MFKSVEYVGFENQPELRAKAERAQSLLGEVIRSWRDEVTVWWKPTPAGSSDSLELSLSFSRTLLAWP